LTALEADVVVAGAGPAGATLALNLAPFWRVLAVDRHAGAPRPVGESLAPAARRLLRDMRLWDAFLAEGHAPSHGSCSIWGGPAPIESSALRDLDGPGWHLDRRRFDAWLRSVADARGAAVLRPADIKYITRTPAGWNLNLALGDRRMAVNTRFLVDAAGRGAPLARRLGARRVVADRLTCRWLHGYDRAGRQGGVGFVAAEAEGWWYTAPLSHNRRVLAFYTDADLPAAGAVRRDAAVLRRAERVPSLTEVLGASGFVPDAEGGGFCAAHSTTLEPSMGDGWVAIGDAALGFDPLSARGLFHALYTGLAAAEAIDRLLAGEINALQAYQSQVAAVARTYRAELLGWYGLERRWTEQPFWRRRHKIN
jgi:flavin-dependent dehydrogenase